MRRDILGEIIFWASVAFAFLVYGLSAPEELPWAGSVLSVLAVRFPVWGYFVEVFAGHYVALAVVSAAIAGGLVGALVNCYVGWRFGVAAALVWVMSPLVWNRAVTGAPELFATAGVITALWFFNGVALLVTERARCRLSMRRTENPSATLKGGFLFERETRNYLVAGYIALAASVLFAGFSLYRHDYRLGEAAGAYAKVVTGPAASVQEWSARWEALTPHLGSRDRFIPIMRHAFADEGRTLARRLMEENRPKEAWDLLWRVYTVVDPCNDEVLVQMTEIYRGGYQPDGNMPLGRASVTEPCLRKAINMTDEGQWVYRLALARILKSQERNMPEVVSLIQSAAAHAPDATAAQIHREFEPYFKVSHRKLERVIVNESNLVE